MNCKTVLLLLGYVTDAGALMFRQDASQAYVLWETQQVKTYPGGITPLMITKKAYEVVIYEFDTRELHAKHPAVPDYHYEMSVQFAQPNGVYVNCSILQLKNSVDIYDAAQRMFKIWQSLGSYTYEQ